MHLTGNMHLIKSAKHGRWGVHKERVEGRKAYTNGQEATKERNSRCFLLQPTSSLQCLEVYGFISNFTEF